MQAVRDWVAPRSTNIEERFLGFANYYRGFMAGYAQLAFPLYHLTGKKPFIWGQEQQAAFDVLKKALTSPPVLALPTPGDFVLDTDASAEAIGAVLSQIPDGQEKPIAYGSLSLSAEQRRYCTTRKELLAVVCFTHMYRHYLLGRKFIVQTDRHSLIWLLSFRCPKDQLARWLEELSQYHMVIQPRAGHRRCNADALSRLPVPPEGCCTLLDVHLSDLPCGGCTK